jgi:hypothetical protein
MNRYLTWSLGALLLAAPLAAQDPDYQPEDKKKAPASTTNEMKVIQPQGVAEAQKGRGKLFIKENVWDFGHVGQNTRITHVFMIQNVGDDTLFIERIKPT